MKPWRARFLTRLLCPALVLACLLAVMIDLRPSQAAAAAPAAPPLYLRADGDDSHCDGTADRKYSSTVEPACALRSIEAAVTQADLGGIIYVGEGIYLTPQITLTKNLTIEANPANYSQPVIISTYDSIDAGDLRGWFVVASSVTDFTLSGLIFDGGGQNLIEAIRAHGTGLIAANHFRNITYTSVVTSPIAAPATAIFFDSNVQVRQNTFTNIGHAGVRAVGANVTAAAIEGNVYTGNGPGSELETGIEIGAGARALISGNTISGTLGISGTESSSAIRIGGGLGLTTAVQIESNTLTQNAAGIWVEGQAEVTAQFNRIVGNETGLIVTGSQPAGGAVRAVNNWWGCNGGPGALGCDPLLGPAEANPWLLLTLEASQDTLVVNNSLVITGSLTTNSDQASTLPLGHVPDAIPVGFGAVLGSLTVDVALTQEGQAHTTFTAGNVTGTSLITATLDSQSSSFSLALISGRVYLPHIFNNLGYFMNGDFEQGLNGWQALSGPFNTGTNPSGSGLPARVVEFNGSQRGLLGDPAARDDAIPVGYGALSQTFLVQQRYLQLDYRVISYDVIQGTQGRYYDSLEISLNRPPAEITDAERLSQGCASNPNPTGTVTAPTDGLVFCAGYIGQLANPPIENDLGWKTVRIDLQAYQGQIVTLYISIWSREYSSPYILDRAWWNTWAYVDHIHLTD